MDSIEIFTSSATNEWGTPPAIVADLRLVYPLVLDVCATPGREMCPYYYAPPLEQIGTYKVTKGPEKGVIKIDHAFRAKALARMQTHPPVAIDALAQPWAEHLAELRGVAWMNPPFGREIGPFLRKTFEQAKLGACVVAIIPSRTGTKWWHEYVEPVRKGSFPGDFDFWKGRMTFTDRDGEALDPAPFDMAVVVWDGRKLGA